MQRKKETVQEANLLGHCCLEFWKKIPQFVKEELSAMKKTQIKIPKKKIRVPLPKQTPKIKESAKVYDRKRSKQLSVE